MEYQEVKYAHQMQKASDLCALVRKRISTELSLSFKPSLQPYGVALTLDDRVSFWVGWFQIEYGDQQTIASHIAWRLLTEWVKVKYWREDGTA